MKTTAIKTYSLALVIGLSSTSLALAKDYVMPLGDYGGRPTIEVSIDGLGPYTMILDTGAPDIIVDLQFGKDLGFESVSEATISSPGGGGMPATIFQSRPIDLGGYEFRPSQFTGIDFTALREGAKRRSSTQKRGSSENTNPDNPGAVEFPSGIFGLWVLNEGVVAIDFREGTLEIDTDASLSPESESVLELNYSDDFFFPQFEMSVGDFPVNGHIDTGSPGQFIMATEWKDKLPLIEEAKVIGRGMLADGPRDVWGGQLDGEVVIAGYVVKNPDIRFMDGVTGVNVGSGFFKEGGFRIDRENDLIEIFKDGP